MTERAPAHDAAGQIVGVLLAAGRGRRFDASGAQSKLMQVLPSGPHAGCTVVQAAALSLRRAVEVVIAVVRPGDDMLVAQLTATGCALVLNPEADDGMGTSIACGVRATANARGWLIALADMPAVAPRTIAQVVAALQSGAPTVVPAYRQQRGHPVGFGAALGPQLAALRGDQGARAILRLHPPQTIDVDDPGCVLDLDTPQDFAALARKHPQGS